MRYKVLLYNQSATSDVDLAGNFEFYTRASAETCCSTWCELSTDYRAYLFNGSSWSFFTGA